MLISCSENYRKKAVFIQQKSFFERVYGEETRDRISELVDVLGDVFEPKDMPSHQASLAEADIVFSGWGAPPISDVLNYCKNLKAIFFAGGTASYMLKPEIWERNIIITSSYAANAVPVAEYSLAAILMGLKGAWRSIAATKLDHNYSRNLEVPGAFGSSVGLISCGAIGRELLRLLRSFDLKILVYDPFLSDSEIIDMNAEPADLDKIFASCDVVSLHAPELEETRGMITAKHFEAMKPQATFVNTARGSLVKEDELCEVATRRPDLQFVLDVLHPEPPPKDSPLYRIPNVFITPHIAGAMANECKRMGHYMVDELERYLSDTPLRWVITPGLAARSSHRPEFMRPPDLSTYSIRPSTTKTMPEVSII